MHSSSQLFQSLPSFLNIYNKDNKTLLPFSFGHGEDSHLFRDSQLLLFPRDIVLLLKKNLLQHLHCLIQCNMTHKIQLSFFISERFPGKSAGAKKAQTCLGYDLSVFMEVEVYIEQHIHSNSYCYQIDRLQQILAKVIISILINVNTTMVQMLNNKNVVPYSF